MTADLKKWLSAGERLLRTFAVAFLGVYVLGNASDNLASLDVLKKAALAGVAAAMDLALSLLGGNVGNKQTPSLLPKPADPTTKAAPVITVAAEPVDEHAGVAAANADKWPPAIPAGLEPWTGWTGEDQVKAYNLPRLDPRLGRNVRHDPRSKQYAIPEGAAPTQTVEWVQALPCFDQGDLGSCTGNAAAGWLATANKLRPGLTVTPDGKKVNEALAVALYSAATQLDSDPDNYPPKDTGSSGLAVAKALKNAGYATSYSHAFSLQAMYTALANGPVLAGTDWYESMFTPGFDGRIVVDTHSQLAGGHEYLIWKLEVANGQVTKIWMRNSWGTDWGVNGCGWFTPEDFAKLLANDGDVTQPMPISVGPDPAPAPSGDATFQAALGAYPKLAGKLAANAAAKKMTVQQDVAWKVAGDLNAR